MQLVGVQLVSKVCIINLTLCEQKQVKECNNLFILLCQGKVIRMYNGATNMARSFYFQTNSSWRKCLWIREKIISWIAVTSWNQMRNSEITKTTITILISLINLIYSLASKLNEMIWILNNEHLFCLRITINYIYARVVEFISIFSSLWLKKRNDWSNLIMEQCKN